MRCTPHLHLAPLACLLGACPSYEDLHPPGGSAPTDEVAGLLPVAGPTPAGVDLLVVRAPGSTTAFSVYPSRGDGGFHPPLLLETGLSEGQNRAVVVDLDGDGQEEIAHSSDGSLAVTVQQLQADGSWRGRSHPELAFTPFAGGDVDGDGRGDLVGWSAAGGTGYVALGQADGSLELVADAFDVAGTFHDYRQRLSARAADLDGDGLADLVTASYSHGGLAPARLYLHPGLGDGRFGAPQRLETLAGAVNGLDLADIDGDGLLDVVAGLDDDGDAGQVWALPRRSDHSGFAPAVELFDVDPDEDGADDGGYGILAFADWDLDGRPDATTNVHTDAFDAPEVRTWSLDEAGYEASTLVRSPLPGGTTGLGVTIPLDGDPCD